MNNEHYLILAILGLFLFVYFGADFLASNTDSKRYFLISYTANTSVGREQKGNLFFSHPEFPSNKWIKEYLIEHDSTLSEESIVVQTIFEFNGKKDFNKFYQE